MSEYDPSAEQASLIAEAKRVNPGVHWETLFSFLRAHYRLYFQEDGHDRYVVAYNYMEIAAAVAPLASSNLVALAPNTVVHGGSAFNIQAIGQSFFNGASIVFDGNVINPTTFVDANSLVGSVKSNWIASARTVQVSVRNADGQASPSLPFTIT
jgi:hypothetical protein